MALTNAQKVSIRYWLGYSGRFFQTDSVLEQAMSSVDDADFEAQIATVLSSLSTIDGQCTTARANAGLKQVDEVVFQDGNNSSLRGLLEEGSMMVGRLAAMLAVPVRHNPFSTSTGPQCGYMRQG